MGEPVFADSDLCFKPFSNLIIDSDCLYSFTIHDFTTDKNLPLYLFLSIKNTRDLYSLEQFTNQQYVCFVLLILDLIFENMIKTTSFFFEIHFSLPLRQSYCGDISLDVRSQYLLLNILQGLLNNKRGENDNEFNLYVVYLAS